MTQVLQSPYAVPVMQIIAGVAVLQLLNRSPITDFVGRKLEQMATATELAISNMVFDLPVIAISAGITFVVHQIAENYGSLLLSTQVGIEGSWKAAAFVAGIFALKAASFVYPGEVCKMTKRYVEIKDANKTAQYTITQEKGTVQEIAAFNLLPLAVGTAAAYYAEVPLNLSRCALYTAALIPTIKLLGHGLEYIRKIEFISNAADGIFDLLH